MGELKLIIPLPYYQFRIQTRRFPGVVDSHKGRETTVLVVWGNEMSARVAIAAALVHLCGCITVNAAEQCEDLDSRVRALIYELTIPVSEPSPAEIQNGKQSRLFREIEELGTNAVPSIIRNMDSRAPLQYKYIALRNPSGSGREEVRQYNPELVVDAMAAILNQLTGHHFGSIETSIIRTNELRDKTVLGWREYLRYQFHKDFPSACGK